MVGLLFKFIKTKQNKTKTQYVYKFIYKMLSKFENMIPLTDLYV